MVNQPTTISVSTLQGSKPVLLPAGCRVYLNVPATHHTERYWPDPYKLDPTRWMKTVSDPSAAKLDKNVVASDKNRHMQGRFLTFSDGARACLGRKFAQAEYVAFFVSMLREFRVVLREDMDSKDVEEKIFRRCKGTLTLAPLDNIGMILQKRGH